MSAAPEPVKFDPASSSEPWYIDLQKNPQPTTWERIMAAVAAIQAYFQAIERRFVERDLLVRQLMHAMMMREHVLIDGPSGAAKSMLIRTVFSGIREAKVWSMDLTQFTTETHLFGAYDVRVMQGTGRMVHMTDGTIADAHFAEIGELMDASDAALRTLLGALNERVTRKGPQIIELPLLTAVADTNFGPESLGETRRAKLDAVIDRFLFRVPVGYVKDPRNRLAMLDMSCERVLQAPLPPVTLEDFVIVSGSVHGMNLIQDAYVRQAYEELTRLFSERRVAANGKPLSDRRYIHGAQILEIAALLAGRREVNLEDLAITEYVLAHTEKERELLLTIRREILGEWVKRASRREIEGEIQQLSDMTAQIPQQPTLERYRYLLGA